MEVSLGLLIILIAGFCQGTFVLPMTLTRNWNWENIWFSFSLFGMIILNLALAFLFIPDLFSVYQSVPENDLFLLILFGLGWGIGAVLFGIAMNRVGMALGYPVIMGLIATFGALIPMLVFHSEEMMTLKGGTLILGSIIVVAGVVICGKAYVLKEASDVGMKNVNLLGVLTAVAAGILSCLPNIGYSFSKPLIDEALKAGASDFMAGNAVWALFFTVGFIPNAIYTLYLVKRNKSLKKFKESTAKNIFLGFVMALMWIGSFYLYGISTIKLGSWGAVIGWPLFIALSIIIGNLWGISKTEWKNASIQANMRLKRGIAVIVVSVVIISICNLL